MTGKRREADPAALREAMEDESQPQRGFNEPGGLARGAARDGEEPKLIATVFADPFGQVRGNAERRPLELLPQIAEVPDLHCLDRAER